MSASPERVSRVVAWWARRYTRGLPPADARRRLEELGADLHDHVAHERAAGTPDGRIALAIAARMLRGAPADVAWRARVIDRSTTTEDPSRMHPPTTRSVLRVALVTGLILLLPLITTLASDGEGWSVGDFVLGAVLLGGSGLLLELMVTNRRHRGVRAVAVAVGLLAAVFGNADDAPGLVLFGLLLIGATIALSLHAPQRSA
jgi:hypothetical protein